MALTGTPTDSNSMTTVRCCDEKCGVEYLIPRHIYDQARDIGKARTFYCPNGHPQVYAVSEADRLRARVADLEASLDDAESRFTASDERLQRAWRTIAYWKGIVTRLLRSP